MIKKRKKQYVFIKGSNKNNEMTHHCPPPFVVQWGFLVLLLLLFLLLWRHQVSMCTLYRGVSLAYHSKNRHEWHKLLLVGQKEMVTDGPTDRSINWWMNTLSNRSTLLWLKAGYQLIDSAANQPADTHHSIKKMMGEYKCARNRTCLSTWNPTQTNPSCLSVHNLLSPKSLSLSPFWAAYPKGMMSCRTRGNFGPSVHLSVRPSVPPSIHLSICPSPEAWRA